MNLHEYKTLVIKREKLINKFHSTDKEVIELTNEIKDIENTMILVDKGDHQMYLDCYYNEIRYRR
jgi:hypothetical protein